MSTWAASPNVGGHQVGDEARGPPAEGPRGCGPTGQGPQEMLRKRQPARIGGKVTTPNVSFRWSFREPQTAPSSGCTEITAGCTTDLTATAPCPKIWWLGKTTK